MNCNPRFLTYADHHVRQRYDYYLIVIIIEHICKFTPQNNHLFYLPLPPVQLPPSPATSLISTLNPNFPVSFFSFFLLYPQYPDHFFQTWGMFSFSHATLTHNFHFRAANVISGGSEPDEHSLLDEQVMLVTTQPSTHTGTVPERSIPFRGHYPNLSSDSEGSSYSPVHNYYGIPKIHNSFSHLPPMRPIASHSNYSTLHWPCLTTSSTLIPDYLHNSTSVSPFSYRIFTSLMMPS